jgi:hypothetical protein
MADVEEENGMKTKTNRMAIEAGRMIRSRSSQT